MREKEVLRDSLMVECDLLAEKMRRLHTEIRELKFLPSATSGIAQRCSANERMLKEALNKSRRRQR